MIVLTEVGVTAKDMYQILLPSEGLQKLVACFKVRTTPQVES